MDYQNILASLATLCPHLSDAQRNALFDHLKCGLSDLEPDFAPVFERCKQFTMTSDARMYAMYNATRYVVQNNIPGSIAECGVWRGGSVMVSLLAMLQLDRIDRDFYLYDTYEGLPAPTKEDVDLWGTPAQQIWENFQDNGVDTLAHCSLEEAKRNILSTGYPEKNIYFVKGMVEETIPATAPEQISILRLDTDWYASLSHVLAALYDRISPGGVVIVDDYGHFAGARKAVDEFIEQRSLKVLLNRIDYTGRLFLKP